MRHYLRDRRPALMPSRGRRVTGRRSRRPGGCTRTTRRWPLARDATLSADAKHRRWRVRAATEGSIRPVPGHLCAGPPRFHPRTARLQENDAGYAATQHRSRPAAAAGGDHMTKKTTTDQLSRMLSIPKSRALEATLKAQLIAAVVREAGRRGLTHAELAHRSGLPRSAVTGILAGSLQRVTIDRLLRLVEAAGLEAAIRIRRAA